MAPIKARTLAERALNEIQARILSGELAPNQRLRLEELAASLDLSPMPVREALQRLEALGLVERVPHRGARVLPLTAAGLLDNYAARIPLETLAARNAARLFTDEHAEAIQAILDEYIELNHGEDIEAAREKHREFHFALYDAAGSKWLNRLIRPLFEASQRYRYVSLPIRGSAERTETEHQAILDACIAHDLDRAGEAMREHLFATVSAVAPRLGMEGSLAVETVEVVTFPAGVEAPMEEVGAGAMIARPHGTQ